MALFGWLRKAKMWAGLIFGFRVIPDTEMFLDNVTTAVHLADVDKNGVINMREVISLVMALLSHDRG